MFLLSVMYSPPVDLLPPLVIALLPRRPYMRNRGIAMKTGPHSRRRHRTCIIAVLPPALSQKRRKMLLEATTVKMQLFHSV